ncbi:MAG TPA: DUF4249 domain-containing protein [Cyclobacteriaceae bacterium]|nr:DUF4249 domain-containing protein [Cyclobacteriaceae bacterium]
MLRPAFGRSGFYVGLLVLSSCLDTYDPPMDLQDVEVLVIDGFLDGTANSVTVNISHAQSLASSEPPVAETGSAVTIYDENGSHFTLSEGEAGVYSRSNLQVDPHGKYQLRITTTEGAMYESDYVEVRQAPQITDVSIEPKEDLSALEVFVSAKDPSASTRYYRWHYLETWEYTAPFRSDFKIVNNLPQPRLTGEGIYRCYRTKSSTRILVGTSVQLSEDIINDQLINTIPVGDQRTFIRYSVEVIQRAITHHEFEYLKQLQQSTEGLGGLFDPLPSQLYGNVRNIGDSSIPVLGYFSAGSTRKMREFYDREQLPAAMKTLPDIGKCVQDTICVVIPSPYGLKCSIDLKGLKGTEIITGTLFKEFETIGFLSSTKECADCRTQGGVTTRPDFW